MQPWFQKAKLGIFIHWGIYAVKGIPESWSFYKGDIPYKDYMEQCKDFTAKNYDPREWAMLFRNAGAKYAVLTSKHHDGLAMWDTTLSDLNVVEKTPANRDIVGSYCDALREQNIKVGLYFSHIDWSHPDYASVMPEGVKIPTTDRNTFSYPQKKDDHTAWARFLKFHRGQIKELCVSYNPDLLWFDGDWERSSKQWGMAELREDIQRWQPRVILTRMKDLSDYSSPEQGIPITPPKGPWELCMTVNDSWGYQQNDNNYKTPQQIIDIFVDCISKGGNLLLDIGPEANGTIPSEQENILRELGKWTSKHEEAIYGVEKGIPYDHFYGPTALSKDKSILYLFVHGDANGQIALKGVKNKINRIWVVGNGTKLNYEVKSKVFWNQYPGLTYIDIPESVLDEYCTVLAVLLDGPVDLYRETVGAIESN